MPLPSLTGNSFDPNTDIPDLSGKVYVVTGGTSGIGYGITAHLLQHNPAKIYILSKKEEHADEAMAALKEYGDTANVEWKKCELEDLKQVDEVATELSKKLDRLDGLICNAGLGVGVYNETKDGIDSHMQVNHLAQFHLVLTLLPLLLRTPSSRLVCQSSELHRGTSSNTRFSSLADLNQDIGAMKLYNRSKLAQVLFVRALVRRAEKGELRDDERIKTNDQKGKDNVHGCWMNVTHPGGVATDQQDQAVEAYGTLGKVGVKVTRPFMKDPVDEGCRPVLFAATSPVIEDEKIQGAYIVPDRKVTEPSSQAKDEQLGEELWRLSESLLSERLGSLNYRTWYVDPMGKEGVHDNL